MDMLLPISVAILYVWSAFTRDILIKGHGLRAFEAQDACDQWTRKEKGEVHECTSSLHVTVAQLGVDCCVPLCAHLSFLAQPFESSINFSAGRYGRMYHATPQ